MVTRYDVLSSWWASHFCVKMCCSPFLGEKKHMQLITKKQQMFNNVIIDMSGSQIFKFGSFG